MPPETPQEVTEGVALRMLELRTEAGLTQAQLAERLDMTLTNYQRIEHGTQNMTLKTVVRVANALGVRTAELFSKPTGARVRLRGRPRRS